MKKKIITKKYFISNYKLLEDEYLFKLQTENFCYNNFKDPYLQMIFNGFCRINEKWNCLLIIYDIGIKMHRYTPMPEKLQSRLSELEKNQEIISRIDIQL